MNKLTCNQGHARGKKVRHLPSPNFWTETNRKASGASLSTCRIGSTGEASANSFTSRAFRSFIQKRLKQCPVRRLYVVRREPPGFAGVQELAGCICRHAPRSDVGCPFML